MYNDLLRFLAMPTPTAYWMGKRSCPLFKDFASSLGSFPKHPPLPSLYPPSHPTQEISILSHLWVGDFGKFFFSYLAISYFIFLCLLWVWGHTQYSGLILVMHSGITPGMAWRTIKCAGSQIGVGHIQGKHPICCYLSGPRYFIFEILYYCCRDNIIGNSVNICAMGGQSYYASTKVLKTIHYFLISLLNWPPPHCLLPSSESKGLFLFPWKIFHSFVWCLCISQMSEIIRYLSWSLWLISLGMIPSCSVQVGTNCKISSFKLLIFHFIY